MRIHRLLKSKEIIRCNITADGVESWWIAWWVSTSKLSWVCMTNSLQNSQVQAAVEMWRYNPRKLSTRNTVDELSLALTLREDADERVEEAVEEMLNELWRKIDGYRN